MDPASFRKLPPLHALAAFEAVARLHSFAQAAEELCITHSAVSHRIKLLEKHFGAQLLVRRDRSVVLTPKGSYFLGAVLGALSALQEASTRLSGSTQKTVRVSVGPSFARNWLFERLGEFYRKYPDVDLEITATKVTKQHKLASLKAGEADVAVRYGLAKEWTGFRSIKLMAGSLFPVCSPSYRIHAGGLKKPADLLKAVLLRLPHERWKPWFDAAGLACDEPIHGPLFSDAGLMLSAATKGQGVALARSVLVDDDLMSGRLVRVGNISIPSPHAYFAIHAARIAARPEVISFNDWLVSCFPAPGSD